MNIASYLRKLTVVAAALAATGLGLAAVAPAAPTITVKARAVPIPGVPGTGNILGAGTAVQGEVAISGTEYGGAPPPLTGLEIFTPAGVKLDSRGFATCTRITLEQGGAAACPRRSSAGAKGSATGVVSFGDERVPETASLQVFFASSGELLGFIDGVSPVLIEMIAGVHETSAPPPFGLEFSGTVPLIETVPGALDASTVRGELMIGAAYRQGKRTVSYITLPSRCPKGGLHGKLRFAFLGGATAEAPTEMPCPRS